MIGRLAASAVLALAMLSAQNGSPATIRGRVFLDVNQNNRMDGEEAVAGCLVSSETALVRSGADGSYRLDVPDWPATVFVVNPPDTWPSDPWWCTFEKGDGDGGTVEHDFPLHAAPQPEPACFVHGTDVHLSPRSADSYRQYVEHVNGLAVPPSFVVHTGDLVLDSLRLSPKEAELLFDLYADISAGLDAPLRNTIGNHEHVGLTRDDVDRNHPDYAAGLYRRRFGPTSYAFRFGRYHFIALNGTTVDPAAEHGYNDRLDRQSLAWAEQYLATVGPEEPIVLLVHQPQPNTAAAGRLLEILRGKHLILSLWGHSHKAAEATWGGAPARLGGAVSYAWHGYLPPPPDAKAYVIYRLEKDAVEFVRMDWAAERSFRFESPAWESIISGRQKITGVVSDLDGSLWTAACELAGRHAEARLSRQGQLADRFEAELDTSGLAGGVYELVITVGDGVKTWEHRRPVIVLGGEEAIASESKGVVAFRLHSARGTTTSVTLNGQSLATLPLSERDVENCSVAVPDGLLKRLNRVVVQPARSGAAAVSDLKITVRGKPHRDVRFAPTRPVPIQVGKGDEPAIGAFYIDLDYQGPQPRE